MNKTIVILSHVVFDESPYCSFVHNHAKELKKQGYNVVVFAGISWFPILSHFQKYKKNFMKKIKNNSVQTIDGVKIIYKKTLSFSNFLYNSSINLNGISYYNSFKKLFAQIANDNDIVLIDAHTFKTEGYAAYRLKKKYPQITTTVTLHGTSFERNTKTQNGIKFIKKVFSKVDYAVCVSYKFKKILESFGINNSKVIFNGISQYENPRLEKEEFENNIITVANLIKQKNIDIVIKAIKSISEEYENIRLTVVGSGKEYNNLEKLVSELQMTEKVQFLGRVTNDKVLNLMNESYIFLMPSSPEGFGIVYAEAMNLGCLTIGTKNEGIDGFIVNEENGFLVNPDVDEISKLIKNIYQNKYNIKEIRKKAYSDSKELTWQNNAKNYLDLIRK